MTRPTDTKTLVGAMRILAGSIESDDGIANAAIAEAADRIESQHAEIERPRHRHNRRKTSQAPLHLPPHPVHAWRTFEPLYGLLDQLQTGSIDAVHGRPVMRAWESNELVEVVPALDGWICCWKRIVAGEKLAIDLKPMVVLYRNLKFGLMLQERHLTQAKDCNDACYQAYLRIPRGRMIDYSKTEQIQIEMEFLGIVETQECTA